MILKGGWEGWSYDFGVLRVEEVGLGSGWVGYAVLILTIKGGGDATQ